MQEISQATQLVWIIAVNEAAGLQHDYIATEHIFIGLCKIQDIPLEQIAEQLKLNPADIADIQKQVMALTEVLSKNNLDPVSLRRKMRKFVGMGDTPYREGQIIHRNPRCKKVFRMADEIQKRYQSPTVEPLHLFSAILEEGENRAFRMLSEMEIDTSRLKSTIDTKIEESTKQSLKSPYTRKTPFLNQYGRDINSLASQGKLNPIIGREKEITKIAQILAQKKKNNVLLVGDAGVGKTGVVEGFAQRVVSKDAPPQIQRKRIIEINVSSLVAGTKYRGDFESRFQKILQEVGADENIILFIDEIHTVMGAGSAGGSNIDAANMLKPALSKGEIRCIGATTTAEYRKYIEKDSALERRFQVIWVDEPTKEDTIEILKGLRGTYESFHKVKISDEAIKGAVELSMRYLIDRRLPDKAIDLIDEASAQAKFPASLISPKSSPKTKPVISKEERIVTYQDIARVVSERCKIPLEQLTEEESQRLLHMEEIIKARVMGQEEAVREICRTIRAARAGLKDPRRPEAVFFFLGMTGVGKTETAKALAEFLFHDENKMIVLDMSEYMEKHTVSKLIGSPPGYVGYEEEGQLTGKVRNNPYSVLLFDELEKAHPDILNIFLQIFDEGRLTDSKGRRADFRNSIIILTSNIGGSIERKRPIGFSTEIEEFDKEGYAQKIIEAVEKKFPPEFLNRIQKKVIFYPLKRKHLKKIIFKILTDVNSRLKTKGLKLEIDEEVYDLLIEKGYSDTYGVREMERVIDQLISELLGIEISMNKFKAGETIKARVEEDRVTFNPASAKEKQNEPGSHSREPAKKGERRQVKDTSKREVSNCGKTRFIKDRQE